MLKRSVLLFVFFALLIPFFAQTALHIDWESPQEGALLEFDSGQWWFTPPLGGDPDSCFRVFFESFSGFNQASLWIKISHDGGPLELVESYESEFGSYTGDVWGNFNLLGLEPGGMYDLCAHIADTMLITDTTVCVHFYTRATGDSCPPVVLGFDPTPMEECFWYGEFPNMSFAICDNSLDCFEVSGVDTGSVRVFLSTPLVTHLDITSHIWFSEGGPHCFETHFNFDYPCDSLLYKIVPDHLFQICVIAADNAGNWMPETLCVEYMACTDSCSFTVNNIYIPYGHDTLCFGDGYWHTYDGDTSWSFWFDENYTNCPFAPVDMDSIGVQIRSCGAPDWFFLLAPDVEINIGGAYCRLEGQASGLYNDFELEHDMCYEFMCQVIDMAGNVGVSTVDTFYTCPAPVIPDSCEPYVSEWHPNPESLDCFPHDGLIWFTIIDPLTEYCACTGIEFIEAMLYNNGHYYNFSESEGLSRINIDDCSAKFIIDTSAAYALEPGTGATLTVHVYDGGGRTLWDSIFFTVCDTSTPPVDSCPPYVSHWWPSNDSCINTETQLGFEICDDDERCDNSGIDNETVVVWARVGDDILGDITSQCFLDPAGDCLVIMWHHTGMAFPTGAEVEICIDVYDHADNHLEECYVWQVCPGDTCCPEISWNRPIDGDTLFYDDGTWFWDGATYADSTFMVSFIENGCPSTGIDSSSIELGIHRCGEATWTDITEYDGYISWDYGHVGGGFGLLDLEPGQCYEMCFEISDNAGNRCGDCVTFYTAPPEDNCPPIFHSFHPALHETLCPPDEPIWFIIEDPDSDDCICTGIDESTIYVNLYVSPDFLELRPDSGLILETLDDCRIEVTLDPEYYLTWAGWEHAHDFGVEMWTYADDNAGNYGSGGIFFNICEVDTCPPYVDHWSPPNDSCISLYTNFQAMVCEDIECIVSGIDYSSIVVSLALGEGTFTDITEYCYVDTGGDCVYIGWSTITGDLPPGTDVTLCLDVADNAGNVLEQCRTWHTCGEPADECPPFVSAWFHGDEMPIYCFEPTGIWFNIQDPLGDLCPICTDINQASVEVELIAHGDTFNLTVGSGLILDELGTCGIQVLLDDAYYNLLLGDFVVLCVYAEDVAGNEMYECTDFNVCDSMPIDSCPPQVYLEYPPLLMECLFPDSGHIIVDVVDPTGDTCYSTGVDSSTIVVTIEIDGVSQNITEECDIWNNSGSWRISWFYTALPEGVEVEFCVTAEDNAGNSTDAPICFDWTTCGDIVDECPPIVEDWHPAHADTFCFEHNINFVLVDPVDDGGAASECPICTGIDSSSIDIWLIAHEDTFILLPGMGFWLDRIGDCSFYVGLDDAYYNLHHGDIAELCVACDDIAGNHMLECIEFWVCDSVENVDSCPPQVYLEYPWHIECLFPDSGHIIADIIDPSGDTCFATGIMESSILVTINNPAGDDIDITEECDIVSAYDGYRVTWFYEGLTPGSILEFCVYAEDNAGNEILEPECFEWSVCGELDECPPIVEAWNPENGDTFCFDGYIHALLVDPVDTESVTPECPICTGIDLESVEAYMFVCVAGADVDTYYFAPDAGLILDPGETCHLYVGFDPAYYWLEPNSVVELCIGADDNAGNNMLECIEFVVCDTTLPEDNCPPAFVNWDPDSCLEFGEEFSVYILDPLEPPDCPFASGVNRTNYYVEVIIGSDILDVTSECIVDIWGGNGISITWGPTGFVLPADTDVEVCVWVTDLAGNYIEECYIYHTCPHAEDICSPNVQWHPEDGDTLCPPDAPVWMRIIDPFDPPECYCTGIDYESIEVFLYNYPNFYEFGHGAGLIFEVVEDCIVDIALDRAYFDLIPETYCTLCVSGLDNAENEFSECIVFFVCDTTTMPEDSCPPTILWAIPFEGETLFYDIEEDEWLTPGGESMFDVNMHEEGCPPTGIETYALYLAECGATPTTLTGYDVIIDPNYVYAYDEFNDLGLEPEECYTLCAQAVDGEGNTGYECVTFYTAPVEDVDLCAPIVSSWFPTADSCIDPESPLGLILTDRIDDICPIATGVDTSTIAVTLMVEGAPPLNITGECEIDDMGFNVGIEWNHTTYSLPEGTNITLCIDADDYAGNSMFECFDWLTCGEPDTVDECAPMVYLEYPDGCLPAHGDTTGEYPDIMLAVVDDYEEPCYISGVDIESIIIHWNDVDVTTECAITGGPFEGYTIEFWYGELTPGDSAKICVFASDLAGNSVLEPICYYWYVCPEDDDICEPVVTGVSIDDGEIDVPVDAFIGFNLEDPYYPPECYCTGINPESVVLTINGGSSFYEFTTTSGLNVHIVECLAYGSLDSSILVLDYDIDYELCIYATDNAGNVMETHCIDFATATSDTTDIWPPCFDEWFPEDGAVNVPVTTDIGVGICDICEGAEFVTGVDSVFADIMALTDEGDTISIDFDIELTPIYCAGYYVNLYPIDNLPECANVFVNIWASDSAGNWSDAYISFTTHCPDTTDILPPCVAGLWPLPETTNDPDVEVSVSLCDNCDGPGPYSGVDSSTIIFTVNGVDVTGELEFAPIDCYGWGISWIHDPLAFGEYMVCVAAGDYAGNFMDTCWGFHVFEDTIVDVTIIEPLNDTWVNNECKSIIVFFDDGVESAPDGFTFTVNGTEYTLTSPEVWFEGDTMFFEPCMYADPWEDGAEICFEIGTAEACFMIDLTPPEIEFLSPDCGDTLAELPEVISISFTDELSGVDEATIGVHLSSGDTSWSFNVTSTGVSWESATGVFTIDLDLLGIVLYGSVSIYAWAGDSPDYSYDLYYPYPNWANMDCAFYIAPAFSRVIAGNVTDILTFEPIEDALVVVMPYIYGWPTWLYPAAFELIDFTFTDASGFYSFEVGVGRWMVLVRPPVGPIIFWDSHYFPLDADPIHIGPAAPDTTWANFETGLILPLTTLTTTTQTISGNLQTAGGEPVDRGFVVMVSTDDDEEELSVSSDLTDSLGNFSMPVRTGNYRGMAFRPGLAPSYLGGAQKWQESDSIMVLGDVTDVEFIINSLPHELGTHNVSGKVYDETDTTASEPMRGAIIYLIDPTTDYVKYTGVSNNDGSYGIYNVQDGVYRLTADRTFYIPRYEWELITASDGAEHYIYLKRGSVGIDEFGKVPEWMRIISANPNPFNASTAIQFYIPTYGDVSLDIVDVMGHRVASLFDQTIAGGDFIAIWDADGISSGIYFARLRFEGITSSIKLLLTK